MQIIQGRVQYTGRTSGGQSGLMVASRHGSAPSFVAPVQGTNAPLPSGGCRLTWAPDGGRIAFVSAAPGPETEDASGDPMVITRYLYKRQPQKG